MRLENVPRTLENPWGLEVGGMDLKTNDIAPPTDLALALPEKIPLLISFPCLVENVEAPTRLPVRIKITSLRTSEIQLVRRDDLTGNDAITALCHDRKFPLALTNARDDADLFLEIDARYGLERAGKPTAAKKKREAYQKNLEQELGFVIED